MSHGAAPEGPGRRIGRGVAVGGRRTGRRLLGRRRDAADGGRGRRRRRRRVALVALAAAVAAPALAAGPRHRRRRRRRRRRRGVAGAGLGRVAVALHRPRPLTAARSRVHVVAPATRRRPLLPTCRTTHHQTLASSTSQAP